VKGNEAKKLNSDITFTYFDDTSKGDRPC